MKPRPLAGFFFVCPTAASSGPPVPTVEHGRCTAPAGASQAAASSGPPVPTVEHGRCTAPAGASQAAASSGPPVPTVERRTSQVQRQFAGKAHPSLQLHARRQAGLSFVFRPLSYTRSGGKLAAGQAL